MACGLATGEGEEQAEWNAHRKIKTKARDPAKDGGTADLREAL